MSVGKLRKEGGNNKYRGNCSPKLVEDLISHFGLTEICDYMCGSNTTRDAANTMGIKSNTYDLHSGFDPLNHDIPERSGFTFWHPPYIYVDQLGNLIRPDYLTAEFPIFMEKNNFRRLRFHDLRHSCASLLLASGVSLKEIQEWLGHSNFMITANIYAHLQVEAKRAAANSMTWINNTSLGGKLAVTPGET